MPHKGESVHLFSQLLPLRILIFRQGSLSLSLSPLLSPSLPLSLSYSHLHSGELPRELSSPGAHKLSAFHINPCPLEKLKHLTRKPMPTPAAIIPTQRLLVRETTSAGVRGAGAAGTRLVGAVGPGLGSGPTPRRVGGKRRLAAPGAAPTSALSGLGKAHSWWQRKNRGRAAGRVAWGEKNNKNNPYPRPSQLPGAVQAGS